MENDCRRARFRGTKLPEVRSGAARRPRGRIGRLAHQRANRLPAFFDCPLVPRRPRFRQEDLKHFAYAEIHSAVVGVLFKTRHALTIRSARMPQPVRLGASVRANLPAQTTIPRLPLPPSAPRRKLSASYRPQEDSFVTTPAHFVPASQLARSARSEEVVAKHKKYLWPSVTNYFQQPLVADRGEMQHLWDVEGNTYLDFFGGILTVSVGHCNPKISSKVSAQVNRLQHTSTLFPTEHIVALAEKIAQITPGNLQQSFFTNSGSEANEAAILIARMATGSYDVVALRHAYSGSSAIAKAMTAHAPYRKSGVISVGISHAVNAYCYRCPLHLTYPSCEVACANDVENLIQTGTSGHIAAFIAEPIQGVGGFITPPKEYFKIVFKIVKKYGGLFISDEVQTGWGRTGKKWFGIEQWEVTPDILTSAKGLGNGVPI